MEGVQKYNLVVYDRWGVKVFESSTSGLSWDGKTNSGAEATAGVYYYYCEYQYYSGTGPLLKETYQGNFTLLR